jgi:hypothetical protein
LFDVIGPALQGVGFFFGIIVLLIDANDAAKRTGSMPQHALCHFKPDFESLQAAGDSATQIVNHPRLGEVQLGVEPIFDMVEIGDRPLAACREDVIATLDTRRRVNDLPGQCAQWDSMRLPILRTYCWYSPDTGIGIDFASRHFGDFGSPTASEQHDANGGAKNWITVARPP